MLFLRTVKRLFETFCILAFFTSSVAWATDLTDVTGTLVHVQSRPIRIVTLAPSLAELVFELSGTGDRLVGVSEYTDFPSELKKVKTIGPYSHINLETVFALKPDLVLATLDGNSKDQIGHLRELGVPVIVVGTETFIQIENSITLISTALGEGKAGLALIEKLRSGLRKIQDEVRARKTPARRVLIQLGDDPVIVVGHGSFLHEAIGLVGGTNIYGDALSHYPRPSVEDVVQKNPDVILILALSGDLSSFEKMVQKWEHFPQLKAVQGKSIRILHADSLLRPTGRLLDGLRLLMKAIDGH